MVSRPQATGLALYSRAAHDSAARVIGAYSTSFGLATRLLAPSVRPHVENIYALVRVADEIVDGSAEQAGLDVAAQRELLDALEVETERAIRLGYSANLVVHSFAQTARETGIGSDLTAPFFSSMRRDLSPVAFTEQELRDYIYGSAEVVGLMCLRVFLAGETVPAAERHQLEHGARRLGAAFQKINFLRDLADDFGTLGRRYFPDIDPGHFTEEQKLALVADIEQDLAAARAVIPQLPPGCRRAIVAAHALFSVLTGRVRATPASDLLRTRVSVPTAVKLGILLRSMSARQVRGLES
ncbi:phytoene/squalene synthase family protein [Salinibacterium sp. ZJ450]|uniref:phytoene/squalene synthase family protein n=1 Tax=Salinibacterium sp. ZJ450 TaxID=2708338 RepID=UPI001423CFBB|nr:phytoene/squalene synthase family protein [Salinibacterium sp. ZJ450]